MIKWKSMPAPTEMKKRPSSRPLNGSMSDSSSWRYSLSASTTPARKVPSAGDSPTVSISQAIATTSNSATAVKTSRSRVSASRRNTGRMTKRPARMMRATAPKMNSACSQPGRPTSCAVSLVTPPSASKGKTARMGMTERSWNSSTENEACPPEVLSSPFSPRLCSTIAVDDIANTMPAATASLQSTRSTRPTSVTAAVVPSTCKPPSPKMGLRSSHKSEGFSSRPTRKSIITTPNSAKCITWAPSPTRPSTLGPMATPASR